MIIKITIKKDLTKVKKADKQKQILDILHKWIIENREKRKEFRIEFLSEKYDKYFDEIKKVIGDFKYIKKMSVLIFLADVILWDNSKYKVCRDLHKKFIKLREEVYKDKG